MRVGPKHARHHSNHGRTSSGVTARPAFSNIADHFTRVFSQAATRATSRCHSARSGELQPARSGGLPR